jgi:hypothetical protein
LYRELINQCCLPVCLPAHRMPSVMPGASKRGMRCCLLGGGLSACAAIGSIVPLHDPPRRERAPRPLMTRNGAPPSGARDRRSPYQHCACALSLQEDAAAIDPRASSFVRAHFSQLRAFEMLDCAAHAPTCFYNRCLLLSHENKAPRMSEALFHTVNPKNARHTHTVCVMCVSRSS